MGHAFLAGIKSADQPTLGVGIHQSLLGRGLGRKLTTTLLTEAEPLIAGKDIVLTVVQDNRPAVELYTSLGFEITDRFTSEHDNLPYYAMRRKAPPGRT
jgi:ribosomal protein S18 acetylase RimI-like enzyme